MVGLINNSGRLSGLAFDSLIDVREIRIRSATHQTAQFSTVAVLGCSVFGDFSREGSR
jgi:hypothetical protein